MKSHLVRKTAVGLLLACLTSFAACGTEALQNAAVDAGVVVTFPGGAVTREDVARELNRMPPALRENFSSGPGRDELARSIRDKRLLIADARQRGFDSDPEIRRQVAELEERLIVQALLAAEEKAAGSASDAELRTYFDARREEFAQPERVRVRRILATVPQGASPADRAKARARAEKWAARARHGEDLAKLARDGDGPERTRDGDLGLLARGQDGEDLRLMEAAFALREVGKPAVVECRDGVAVLALLEKREKRLPAFEE
ncbi:MAG: peptidyl-prolyl cis-trans isomerase, partial [Deltaproteobacteria bacterium]|nr:peptidyl-prolyl cis-trans isomerase [Deltaproteobacteria bacterium]